MRVFLGESCYINVDTGNSSYTHPSALAADAAGGSHGNVVCSITLANAVRHYDHMLVNTESVTSRDNDDDDDDDGSSVLYVLQKYLVIVFAVMMMMMMMMMTMIVMIYVQTIKQFDRVIDI